MVLGCLVILAAAPFRSNPFLFWTIIAVAGVLIVVGYRQPPFRLWLEGYRCPHCRYDLRARTGPRCPECGRDVPEHLRDSSG